MRRVEKTASLLNGKEQYCFYEVEKTVFISKHKKLIFFFVIEKKKEERKKKYIVIKIALCRCNSQFIILTVENNENHS